MKPVSAKPFLLCMIMLLSGVCVSAAGADSPAIVQKLLKESLTHCNECSLSMFTVEYPPGGSSKPHRHDADVFVYVLEGEVLMQIEGQHPTHLQAGDTFIEHSGDVHLVSANVSETRPARFLVLMIRGVHADD